MEELSCPNPDCRIAETGKCVEGFEINKCPHQLALKEASHQGQDEVEEIEHADEEALSSESKDAPVTSGEILTVSEATDVLRVGESRVVTVIGPVKAGKTTLGISLYGAFQDGAFGRWNFVGSLTLPAFEKRCHLSRMESGRLTPETPRTSWSDGLGFLHLALYSEAAGRIELLISDRSGEFYSEAAANLEDCKALHEVSRADYVLLLVDGKKLVGTERHGVRSDITLMISAMVQSGVLGPGHRVGMVLTKYDHVISSSTARETETYFDDLVKRVEDRFGNQLADVKSFRIAARPADGSTQPLHGVLEVLEECLLPKNIAEYVPLQPPPQLHRSFHRLRIFREGEQ